MLQSGVLFLAGGILVHCWWKEAAFLLLIYTPSAGILRCIPHILLQGWLNMQLHAHFSGFWTVEL